ncbi:uncharacterized protein LOC117577868 [Drosophila albomicans]|uniref:Uncharacterized protein LOC117577868 n=1 Tax=Drosophila albomicans TaxID=7291 RepID=A0A6P8XQ28_DROAB|nr:uncharacterized protein LOC117577868 [Drosophila albomicans]
MSKHHWQPKNSTATATSTTTTEDHHNGRSSGEPEEPFDPLANLLSLQLHKPAHWNWELSTSRSCSNIALPRILLYDHQGSLLLDADGSREQTYRPRPSSVPDPHRRRKRAATANLAQSLQQAQLPHELHGLRIGEATPSCRSSKASSMSNKHCIDFSTHELPDWRPQATTSSSGSVRGIRFEDQLEATEVDSRPELAYPTPPSTSTLTTPGESCSGASREKRRYRRSHSSGQRSILERFSMSRGRHSSPEYVQEQTLEKVPRYFLRTSKAGTLVIKDESFSRVRQRRRRHKPHSSSDNLLQPQATATATAIVTGQSPAESVVAVPVTSSMHQQQRLQPQRGREPLLSTSEDEAQSSRMRATARQARSRRNQRNGCKDVAASELITVDPGNCVYRASSGATAR